MRGARRAGCHDGRRGIALPATLAALVVLALLSALLVTDALQAWRVGVLAEDDARARGAALRALSLAPLPPDLAALCAGGPGVEQSSAIPPAAGTTGALRWRSLGDGLVRVEAEGRGMHGARHRLVGLLVPDSLDRSGALIRCPAATRLTPVPGRWVEPHPEG